MPALQTLLFFRESGCKGTAFSATKQTFSQLFSGFFITKLQNALITKDYGAKKVGRHIAPRRKKEGNGEKLPCLFHLSPSFPLRISFVPCSNVLRMPFEERTKKIRRRYEEETKKIRRRNEECMNHQPI
jgi:hypothetical protein